MSRERRAEKGPEQALSELLAEIAAAPLRRAYLLRGEERYFRERGLAALRAKAEGAGFEVVTHDAEPGHPDFRLSTLIDDLGGGGLFATQRLIVLRHPETCLRDGEDEGAFLRAAGAFLRAEESGGTLAFSAQTLRADSALAKAVVAAGGALVSFRRLYETAPPWNPDPRRAELVQWALSRARELGLRLAPESAVYLCAAVGNDLFAIEGELETLKRLPAADLRDVVAWRSAAPPWSVAEMLAHGDLPRALAGVENLFRAGFLERGKRLLDPSALTAMTISSLGREVRRNLAFADALERGANPEAAAEALGAHGRAAEALIARGPLHPARVWRRREAEVAELERRSKSNAEVDANDFVALALRWHGR